MKIIVEAFKKPNKRPKFRNLNNIIPLLSIKNRVRWGMGFSVPNRKAYYLRIYRAFFWV